MKNQVIKQLLTVFITLILSLVTVSMMTTTVVRGYGKHRIEHLFMSKNYSYDKKNSVFNDILNGSIGQTYNLDEEDSVSMSPGLSPASLDSKNSCDGFCSSCGPGRENGGPNLLDNGCRNYKGWSYGKYGITDIPYWLNMATIDTIANDSHRNQLIDDIRHQAEMWNKAIMHGGVGQIVNIYETGIGLESRPANINGRRVVEVMRQDGNYAGQFNSSDLQVKINYNAKGGAFKGEM